MTLKIEAGKYYRTRDGRKVGPMVCGIDKNATEYPWTDKGENHRGRWSDFGEDGETYLMGPTDGDIIAEWTDEPARPEVGTLAEIGAQVGDVVEYTAIGEPHFEARQFTFAGWHDGEPYDSDMKIGGDSSLRRDAKAKFRIIRRASDAQPEPAGPVVTETVKPYLAPFDATQRLILEPIANGGWVVSVGSDHPAFRENVIGAFGSAADMLTALADALDGGAK